MVNLSGAKAYQANSIEGQVLAATPHALIALLLNGAMHRIVLARGHMGARRVAEKGAEISGAISIIEGLRSSLDHEHGGEIAANLNALYEYMERRLAEANLRNDVGLLDEVNGLLREIAEGWDTVPVEMRSGVSPVLEKAP